MKNKNNTFNPGMILATELVALIKGVAHALVIPSIIIALGASFGLNSTQAISLGLIYLLFTTFMYEFYAEEDGKWLKSQKYYYAILFFVGINLLYITIASTLGVSYVL